MSKKQYIGTQLNQPSIWKAFLRRINRVIHFISKNLRREYTIHDYMAVNGNWIELPPNTPTPFDSVPKIEEPQLSFIDSDDDMIITES